MCWAGYVRADTGLDQGLDQGDLCYHTEPGAWNGLDRAGVRLGRDKTS